MMDIADGQELPGGDVSNYDAYFTPPRCSLCPDYYRGHSAVIEHCFRISPVKYGKRLGGARWTLLLVRRYLEVM